ncbi:E3 ubiquitin-protein ligase TRIM71-like [Dysidea avara]|uniref:E3 ubiquitin-protein ligase TRIM71-like n=1 Tax=Dysidea avara TaxID=196820 RepID=UPI0033219FD9
MSEPWGIAFSKDGSWAASDWSNHCVYLFNKSDKLLGKFRSRGMNKVQFDRPKGIAFDNDNHLYVADYTNHRVQKFTFNGTYLLQFGNGELSDNQLKYPTSLSIHNNIAYVVDNGNKCLSVFQSDGTFLNTIRSDMLDSPHDWQLVVPTGYSFLMEITTVSTPLLWMATMWASLVHMELVEVN